MRQPSWNRTLAVGEDLSFVVYIAKRQKPIRFLTARDYEAKNICDRFYLLFHLFLLHKARENFCTHDEAFQENGLRIRRLFYPKVLDRSTSKLKTLLSYTIRKFGSALIQPRKTLPRWLTTFRQCKRRYRAKGLTQNMLINIRSTYVVHQIGARKTANIKRRIMVRKSCSNVTDKFYDKYTACAWCRMKKYMKASSIFEINRKPRKPGPFSKSRVHRMPVGDGETTDRKAKETETCFSIKEAPISH